MSLATTPSAQPALASRAPAIAHYLENNGMPKPDRRMTRRAHRLNKAERRSQRQ